MQVVYATQPFPDAWTSAIFLAGPTPRDAETPSWRPEALRLLEAAGYDGVVMVPERDDGKWKSGPDAYMEQVEWERRGLDLCDKILFWIPRDMETMPGLTTNVEFGLYASSGKIVLGAPDWAKSIRYLETALETATGDGTRYLTLEDTILACQTKLDGILPGVFTGRTSAGFMEQLLAERYGGERCVPLHIWVLDSFQFWYRAQTMAGNRLDDAKLLWHFWIPKAKLVFSWVLHVKVWIESEQRHKENEFVLSRTDISTVCLYCPIMSEDGILATDIVLIREFRSPARSADGFVRELPGGSSFKGGQDPLHVASEEVLEETGLVIEAGRFRALGHRQVAATLSAHHAYLFAAELTPEEMRMAKLAADNDEAHGVDEDSERTYVEVLTFRDILAGNQVDWATVGMITQAVLGE